MSKGPGKVQSQLIAIFRKNADRYYSTEELCCRAFGVRRVEKKHRVSVLRALKRISERQALNIYRAVKTHSNDDLWFIYGRPNSALNSLLHKVGAKNIDIASAHDKRPRKKHQGKSRTRASDGPL